MSKKQMETNKNILDHLNLNQRAAVPENYFEEFPGVVFQKLKEANEVPVSDSKVMYFKPFFWISVAASILVLITINLLSPQEEQWISQLSTHEIQSYLIEHIDDIDEEYLLTEDSYKNLGQAEISKDEILDYIENEEVEIEVEF